MKTRPLLGQASSLLDIEWVKKMLGDAEEQQDTDMLPLMDRKNLPNKESVLVLFQFFRNMDKTSSSLYIANKVVVEISKYWAHSNIPTIADWRFKKNILDLNSKYQKILKHLKRDNKTEDDKRAQFQTDLKKLFDIASPEAEKVLRKDKLLGKKKAVEDLMFLDSQRTDRIAG